ncbi:CYTH-like domain-containing protein [Trichoderma evansii]
MDLRSVLNTSDNGDRAPSKAQAPPTPHQQQQQQQQHQRQQSQQGQPRPAQYGYRDYPQQQPPQGSPTKTPIHEYPPPQNHPHHYPQHQQSQQPPQHPPNAYPQQSPYQAPSPYQTRPAPPPLQPPTNVYHDPRSPASSRSNSGPVMASPYRPSPTSATTPGGNAGYPFPPQPPSEMASPVQRQPYPPGHQYHDPRRDSYVQSPGVAPPAHSPAPYVQQQQQQQHGVPQASPVRASGRPSHPFLHHQLQQHTPTPASIQTQHQQYGPQHAQGSPVLAAQPPLADYSRHPSQVTPLGPPQPSVQRQPSAPGAFAQPPSPYQQRMSSIANPAAPAPAHASTPTQTTPTAQSHTQAQAQAQVHGQQQPQAPPHALVQTPTQTPLHTTQPPAQAQIQPSPKPAPPPPPAPPVHRQSSAQSTYASPVAESAQHPRPQNDREQSLSVSPKTRLGSIPSNPDVTPTAADRAARSSLSVHSMAIDSDRAITPAKRKLEDLNMSPGELEYKESKPPPGEVNGGYAERIKKSASPAVSRKTRSRRSQPPVWALSIHTLGKKLPSSANFVLQKRIHSHIQQPAVNGRHESTVKTEHASRQASPETRRNQHTSVSQQPSAVTPPNPQDQLGPWEASITGVKPSEELSKNVADFLFIHVINNQDMQEIQSRGIQFEIEAKLGTLIDKDTNQRVDRFVATECILDDNGRVAFKSSMTEAQHKSYNDFLNSIVIQSDPRNPNNHNANRVPVIYKHRRETDRFFELPQEMHGHLPGCVRARLGHRRNVRVRVTYDQKTNEVLNKIIKARVADIDLHMPMCPMDCRISINLEADWDGSVEELEQLVANKGNQQPDRSKDRLSYTQGSYQIDLTQVTHAVNGPGVRHFSCFVFHASLLYFFLIS